MKICLKAAPANSRYQTDLQSPATAKSVSATILWQGLVSPDATQAVKINFDTNTRKL